MVQSGTRLLFALGLLLLPCSAFAQAPNARAPHIDYADVVSSGYSGPGKEIAQGPIRRNITHTPVRAVEVGTKFSIKIRTAGQPEGAPIALRFVFRAPRPIAKDEKTGKFSREIDEDVPSKIGDEVERAFEFKDDNQIVRGTWRAEVWNGRRRLAMRRFAVR